MSVYDRSLVSLLSSRSPASSKSVMSSSTSKKQLQSAKKRSRDEVDDDDISSTTSKDTKRRNTSKTPVKAKKSTTSNTMVPENGSTMKSMALSTIVSENSSTMTTQYKATYVPEVNIVVNTSNGSSEDLLPPPAGSIGSKTNQVPDTLQKATEKLEPEHALEPRLQEDGTATAKVDSNRSHKSLKRWVAGLAILLVFFSGVAIFVHVSSQVIITNLKQELGYCQAAQSDGMMQEMHYIQELQTQVRAWRKRYQDIEGELESAKGECMSS